MPFLGLHLLLALPCGIHAVRTGRAGSWLFIILMFPGMGSLIYLITQVLPDLRHSRGARRVQKNVKRLLDPQAERRQAAAQLAQADTVANRLRYARAASEAGDFAAAAEQFRACLRGAHEHDPDLMLELAQAQFAGGDAPGARATLDALKAANPTFRSPEGHLLYARALEVEGRPDAALQEYRAVIANHYPGEEARARCALLLAKVGRQDEAKALLGEMRSRFEAAPKFYRRNEQSWLDAVQREVRA